MKLHAISTAAAHDAAEAQAARSLGSELAPVYDLALVADHAGRIQWATARLASKVGEEIYLDSDRYEIRGASPIDGIAEAPVPVGARPLRLCDCDGVVATLDVTSLGDTGSASTPLLVAVEQAPPTGASTQGALDAATERVLTGSPDAVAAVDASGRLVFANPAFRTLLGQSGSLRPGAPIVTRLCEADDLRSVMTALSGEPLRDRDLTLRDDAGAEVHVSASTQRLDVAGGTLTLFHLRDVALRRRIVHDLEHVNAELEHCVNALAHDLRSPLVALLGFSRLLRQDYGDQLDETANHFIDRIEQSGRTMESLAHDLLELSRVGAPEEAHGFIDPGAVLRQLAAELKPRLESGGIALRLPDSPPPVYCNATRLYQVFSNLLINAVEHMGPNAHREIRVDVRNLDGFHVLSVRDSGCGIAVEDQAEIFDVFRTLGARSDKKRGFGIGLAIVKRIAEAHQGRAWVESTPGAGSTFHVTLARPDGEG